MQFFSSSTCNLLAIIVMIVLEEFTQPSETVHGCSVFFQPDFKWKKAICDSVQSRLNHIPLNLPTNLVDLRVTYQYIPALTNHGLGSLIHLETLHIESCNVIRVAPDAFSSLVNLRHLSLRNNSLKLGLGGLTKEALASLSRLETLNLADNPVDLIPDSFFAITSGSPLRSLSIGPTKSTVLHLSPSSFEGLKRLNFLDLGFTRLSLLPPAMVRTFQNMEALQTILLDGNPWHCDCKLRWLNDWLRKISLSGVKYTRDHIDQLGVIQSSGPTCFTPENMYGRSIGREDATEMIFECPPKLLTQDQNITIESGNPVTLSCEFYADPVIELLWYKDGQVVHNTSRTRIVQYKIDETSVSTLHFLFVESSDSGFWKCSLQRHFDILSATFNLTVILGEGSFLMGMSVAQQSWIFAGLGVGVLILVLTSIGIGIFYCCDPRSHSEQTLHRWMGKRRVERLHSCYRCNKSRAYFEKRIGRRTYENGQDEDIVNDEQTQNLSSSRSPKESPLKEICTPKTVRLKTIVSGEIGAANFKPVNNKLAQQNVPLIQNAVSVTENRLLVSCDKPEPTVLLATRLPGCNEIATSTTIHGAHTFEHYKLPFSVTAPTNLSTVDFVGSIDVNIPSSKPNVYAHFSPAASMRNMSTLLPFATQSTTQDSGPCPVHGRIRVHSAVDSYSARSSEYHKTKIPSQTSRNVNEPYDHTPNQDELRHAFTVNDGAANAQFSWSNSISRTMRQRKRAQSSAYERDTDSSSDMPDVRPRSATTLDKWTSSHLGNACRADKPYIKSDFKHTWSKYSLRPAYSQTLGFDYQDRMQVSLADKDISERSLRRASKRNVTIKENDVTEFLSESNGSSISTDETENENTWDSSGTSKSAESGESRYPHPQKLTDSPLDRGLLARSYEPRYDSHRTDWRAYCSQLISPASGSTRSTAYSVSTLPSRIQHRQYHSILKPPSVTFTSGPYTRPKSQFNSRSQTLVRPGSKHKLETDSGTDYND